MFPLSKNLFFKTISVCLSIVSAKIFSPNNVFIKLVNYFDHTVSCLKKILLINQSFGIVIIQKQQKILIIICSSILWWPKQNVMVAIYPKMLVRKLSKYSKHRSLSLDKNVISQNRLNRFIWNLIWIKYKD